MDKSERERIAERATRISRGGWAKTDVLYDIVDDVHTLLQALAAEESEIMRMADAAQALVDEQNGAPLIRREAQWQQAVDSVRASLEAWQRTQGDR